MPNTIQSNYMLLPVPIPSTDPGPTYAFDLNTCLGLIDQHNHSSGQGIPINPTGLNINSDLSFGANNATNLRSSRYSSQSSTLNGALDLSCTYVNGGNLYYNDSLGNKIQMTANGGVAGTPGSITGLIAPAAVNFLSGPGTFQFLSSSATAGNIDAASYILRRQVAGSQSITISAPTTLTSSYTFSPSSALPASSALMTMNSSGQIGYASLAIPPTSAATAVAGSFNSSRAQSLTTSYTPIVYELVNYDSTSAYNPGLVGTSGMYTVSVPGKYQFSAGYSTDTGFALGAGQGIFIRFMKNAATSGINIAETQTWGNGNAQRWAVQLSAQANFVAGDTLRPEMTASNNTAIDTGPQRNFFFISRIGL